MSDSTGLLRLTNQLSGLNRQIDKLNGQSLDDQSGALKMLKVRRLFIKDQIARHGSDAKLIAAE